MEKRVINRGKFVRNQWYPIKSQRFRVGEDKWYVVDDLVWEENILKQVIVVDLISFEKSKVDPIKLIESTNVIWLPD